MANPLRPVEKRTPPGKHWRKYHPAENHYMQIREFNPKPHSMKKNMLQRLLIPKTLGPVTHTVIADLLKAVCQCSSRFVSGSIVRVPESVRALLR